MTSSTPPAFGAITPHLIVRGGDAAIAFYEKAFGAKLIHRLSGPGKDTVMYASMQVGASTLMLADEFPQWKSLSPLSIGGAGLVLHVNVENCDAAIAKAVAAGATLKMPPADMFWGARYGQIIDPFGHVWSLAHNIEDVSPAELEKRGRAMVEKFK